MENKFIALAVGLTVGVIMLSGFLWPVVADATATEKTLTNDGYFRMNEVTDGNFSFSWTYEEPTKFNINGETYTYVNTSTNDQSVVCSETFFIRLRPGNDATPYLYYNGPGGNVTIDGADEAITLTLTDNSGSVSDGTSTYTIANSGNIYHISDVGAFVMKKINETVYMNESSQFFNRGGSTVSGHWVPIVISGSIENGATISTVNTVTVDSESIQINATPVSG